MFLLKEPMGISCDSCACFTHRYGEKLAVLVDHFRAEIRRQTRVDRNVGTSGTSRNSGVQVTVNGYNQQELRGDSFKNIKEMTDERPAQGWTIDKH